MLQLQSGGLGVGGNVTALKLKDRRRDATPSLLFLRFVLLPSSLQPHLVLRWGGVGLVIPYVCVRGGFGVYFWFPFRESVMPAVTTAVGLRPTLARPGAPPLPRGVKSQRGSINKASPRVCFFGFWTGQVKAVTPRGLR